MVAVKAKPPQIADKRNKNGYAIYFTYRFAFTMKFVRKQSSDMLEAPFKAYKRFFCEKVHFGNIDHHGKKKKVHERKKRVSQ